MVFLTADHAASDNPLFLESQRPLPSFLPELHTRPELLADPFDTPLPGVTPHYLSFGDYVARAGSSFAGVV